MQTRLIAVLLAASTLAVGTHATAAPAKGTGGNAATFDATRFGQKLDAALDAATGGYAWSIAQGGKLIASGGDGYARTPADGDLKHGPDQRQNIASVSKMITAVAVLQLLRQIGKDEDAKIALYLPPGWVAGPNVDKITFAHLLGHRSGLAIPNNNSEAILGYDAMRAMVLAGTTNVAPFPALPAQIDYRNVNFALLRVLMSQLYAQTGNKPETLALAMQPQLGKLPPLNEVPAYVKAMNNHVYTGLVQKNVFDKIGVKGALCQDMTPKATLYYDTAQKLPGERSMKTNSWTNFCGSGGWYLSSNDLTRFMTYLRHTEVLLPAPWRERMIAKRFGVSRNSGEHGDYFQHGGVVGSGKTGGIYACMIRFSINVEAAVVINSMLTNNLLPCPILKTAFDAAWQ